MVFLQYGKFLVFDFDLCTETASNSRSTNLVSRPYSNFDIYCLFDVSRETKIPLNKEDDCWFAYFAMVDRRRIELLTSAMRMQRSTS